MRLAIRQRLLVLTASALVPALLAFGLYEYQLRSDRSQDINDRAVRQAQLAASEFARIFEGVRDLLLVTASALESGALPRENCNNFLSAAGVNDPHLTGITVLDGSGSVICGGPPGGGALPQALLEEAVSTRNTYVIGEYVQPSPQAVGLLSMAIPVPLADGRRNTAIAHLRLDWLGARIRERGLAQGDALTVADREGVIIAREPFPERFVGTKIPAPFLGLVASDSPGSMEVISQDGTRRVIGYLPTRVTGGLYVSAGVSTVEAFASINRATVSAGAFMLAGALMALGFAWLAGRKFIQIPVDRLLSVANAWQTGDLSVRTGMVPGPGEFETVGSALDTMMDALQRRDIERENASRQRKLLSRELSHRVRNTLTLVQAIASQTFADGDRDRYRRFSERLSTLASSYDLLLTDEWEGADIRSTIETALRPHRAVENEAIRLDGPPVSLPPQAVVALSLVVHELATNALKYGALASPAGTVTIVWRLTGDSPARLEVLWDEHDGPPVVTPTRKGFGTRLMSRAFPADWQPHVDADYRPEGVRAIIAFNLAGQLPHDED